MGESDSVRRKLSPQCRGHHNPDRATTNEESRIIQSRPSTIYADNVLASRR
jgi:hypothetical protein